MDAIDALLGWIKLRKNSAGMVFDRARLNLIEGTGITITVADDAVNNEVDVTIASAAGGDPWAIMFGAASNEPPASAFATLDTRNSHPVLDFDAATDESAVFRGVLPAGYGGAGVNVKLIWAATSATSGTTRWAVSFERINAGALDIDADSFATAKTTGATADSVSGETTETTIAFSNGSEMDDLAAGEMFRLKVMRDADGTSGTDDMAGDAELLAVVITEQ